VFSHIVVSVSDFQRSFAFYEPIMGTLGHELRFRHDSGPWAGWHSEGGARPFFVICTPFNGQPHEAGNGQMVAFTAPNRAAVTKVFQLALTLGGISEGEPGLRSHYHPHYFGAYVRDPDGNKLCFVCHQPEGA
jgi:catechol 2,3-dioxygenase-like lactoylglutathione lyase family enzyme